MSWVGATLAAVFVAWIALSAINAVVISATYRTFGPFAVRAVNFILTTFLLGGAIGMCQAGVLKRSLDGCRTRWLKATLAGYFLSGLARMLQPEASLQDRSLQTMLLWSGIYAIVGGTALGVFQALALRRLSRGDWLVRWTLVSAGANTLGALAGTAIYYALFQTQMPVRTLAVAGFCRSMVHALLTALPAGLFLGYSLCRHFGTRDQSPTG